MATHRLKHSFTAGELSPLMFSRFDFERFKNGCRLMRNMVAQTQGPATRRPGTKFIYDLASLSFDPANPLVRMIPFIFDEDDAYVLIFFMATTGPRFCLGHNGGLVLSGGSVVSFALPATWDIDVFDWTQSNDQIFTAQPELAQYTLNRISNISWTATIPVFVAAPSEWGTGGYYPETVAFHQQRLAYGGMLGYRQKCWLSKAGDLLNYTVGVAADDSLAFTFDSGTQNKIVWMSSSKVLHVGTVGDEWTVQGGQQTAITPEFLLAQRQTTSGSEKIKPLVVGSTTLFIEKHGRTVNEFVFDDAASSYGGYKTSDITILAQHLTDEYSIIDWCYQKTPHSIVWCVREDGALLGLTYQREHKVVGWHEHTTDGEFLTTAAIPGDTREDDVWFVVKREVDGADAYYIEILADWYQGTTSETARFQDSYLDRDSAPTSTLSGLEHLKGKEVSILADGAVQPSQIVSATGTLTLRAEYSNIAVGLHTDAEIRPLVNEVVLQDGSSAGKMQQITTVDINLYSSLGMSIGRIDEEDGEVVEEVPFRRPTDLTGVAVPLFTGIKHIAFPEGSDREPVYFIRQTQPLPLTVRGVTDVIEVFE